MYLCREFNTKYNSEGTKCPLFLSQKMREKVEKIINRVLENNPELFLIDLKISADNRIQVIVDGDNGVRVEDCVAISREIENQLDREEEDFSLTVMSAGLSEPLQLPRQFKKNIGRAIKLETNSGDRYKGDLTDADEESCKIIWSSREKKPVGKGKITVQHEAIIPYKDIKEAKMMIKF